MNKPILFTHAAKPRMIAHRGLSGIETENTAAAFVAAGQHPYFGIETDVHRTVDGKFIIIHDDNTKRVAGDEMIVEKTTFETLKSENEDVDITEIAIQLSSAKLTYEAALMATGKVTQTSLLNYI